MIVMDCLSHSDLAKTLCASHPLRRGVPLFYATSDVLAKYFLKDRFLDPGAYLWNPSKTAISRTDGKAVLWLRKWMLDADARFTARFAFDEYALGQAGRYS